MAGKGTGRRTIRVDDDLWDEFAAAAEKAGADRSALIRDFVRWFLRKPDAKSPQQVPEVME